MSVSLKDCIMEQFKHFIFKNNMPYLDEYDKILYCKKNSCDNVLVICDILSDGNTQGLPIMFHEYFVKAEIMYLGNVDKRSIVDNYPRITHVNMNAYKMDSLLIMENCRYDFIIDDGAHKLEDQLFIAKNYFHLINDWGLLIIQDIHKLEDAHKILDATEPKPFHYNIVDINGKDIFIVLYKNGPDEDIYGVEGGMNFSPHLIETDSDN